MRTFSIILALATLVVSRAAAQVAVEARLDQDEYLPGESIPLVIKITNQSGQRVHLGAESDWLTFSVESSDGPPVVKNSDPSTGGEFDLESSQRGTLHVDVGPHFNFTHTGRYIVTPTLRIKAWGLVLAGKPVSFDIVSAANLWSQDFGVPTTNGMPQMRRFKLEQASYLHSQMRLYAELSDPGAGSIVRTTELGMAVSFSHPEAQIDRSSELHVLWQSGAQSFDYCQVGPDGVLIDREVYDDFNTRPRLVVDGNGNVLVQGGVRRPKPGELPRQTTPVELRPAQARLRPR